MKAELRYAAHPNDVKNWDTSRLRKEFLIENIFLPDEITFVYSMYDDLWQEAPCRLRIIST